MAGFHLSVSGIPELQRLLEQLPLEVRRRLEQPALERAGRMIFDAISAAAPRRTGRMARELEVKTTQVSGETAVVIRPAYKRVKYTHLVEFGTAPHGGHPGTRARAFFLPAVDQLADAALDQIEREIGDGLEALWAAGGS